MEIRPHAAALRDLEALRPPRAEPRPAVPGDRPASAGAAAPPRGEWWDLLTTEEQAFFREQAALGPLTYGRAPSTTPAAVPTGGRLDVRG